MPCLPSCPDTLHTQMRMSLTPACVCSVGAAMVEVEVGQASQFIFEVNIPDYEALSADDESSELGDDDSYGLMALLPAGKILPVYYQY